MNHRALKQSTANGRPRELAAPKRRGLLTCLCDDRPRILDLPTNQFDYLAGDLSHNVQISFLVPPWLLSTVHHRPSLETAKEYFFRFRSSNRPRSSANSTFILLIFFVSLSGRKSTFSNELSRVARSNDWRLIEIENKKSHGKFLINFISFLVVAARAFDTNDAMHTRKTTITRMPQQHNRSETGWKGAKREMMDAMKYIGKYLINSNKTNE